MSRRHVVVLTRNYSTGLSVIRSLGQAGYEVSVVASALDEGKSALVSSSRYVSESAEVVSRKVGGEGDEKLLEELIKYEGRFAEKPVLLPADDYTASVMDQNRGRLSDIFDMPGIAGGGNGTLTYHMDKSVQGRIAREAGMLTPMEWTVSLSGEISVPDDIIYPCFIKPAQSFLGYKQEMRRLMNREELDEYLHELKESYSERNMLIQTYLDIDNEIDIEGVCIDQEIILPAVIFKDIVAQYDRGVPLAGRVMSFDDFPGLREQVLRVLKSYHYIGMFDMGVNIVDEKYYFNEINLRSGGTNFAYFGSGVNLPDIFVKEVCGEGHEREEESVDRYGRKYFYEKMGYEDLFHNYMTIEEVERGIREAEIKFIESEDDPAPGQIFMEEIEPRLDRIRRREECIALSMEMRGWDRQSAEDDINSAKERLGIKTSVYRRLELWKYDVEDQNLAFAEYEEKREKRRQQKEECIALAMEKAGWDRKSAEENMNAAELRLGIKAPLYQKLELWAFDEEDQDRVFAEYEEKRERRRQQKEECIAQTMESTGWDRETAEANIKSARDRLGISYKDYFKFKMFSFENDRQQQEYEKAVEKRERQKQRREDCITDAMLKAGWDRTTAEEKIRDARNRLGISYKEYMVNNFCLIPESKQEEIYVRITNKK